MESMRPRLGLFRTAFLCGFLATLPAAVVAVAHAPPPHRTMTITVTLKSGAVHTYTACSDYSNDRRIVRLVGVDADGVAVTMEYNLDSVESVRIQ